MTTTITTTMTARRRPLGFAPRRGRTVRVAVSAVTLLAAVFPLAIPVASAAPVTPTTAPTTAAAAVAATISGDPEEPSAAAIPPPLASRTGDTPPVRSSVPSPSFDAARCRTARRP